MARGAPPPHSLPPRRPHDPWKAARDSALAFYVSGVSIMAVHCISVLRKSSRSAAASVLYALPTQRRRMVSAVGYALIAFATQAGAADFSAGPGAGTLTGNVAVAGDYGCGWMASNRFTSACQATASPRAFGVYNTAVGGNAYASLGATALGDHAFGNNWLATAVGSYSEATDYFATAVGAGASASAVDSLALGHSAWASGLNASAIGESARATASAATAIGRGAVSSAAGATAVGANSVANQVNTVSVGTAAAGGQRRIVNLAAGSAATDAVNVAQMNAALAANTDNPYVKATPNSGSRPASATGSAAVAIGSGATTSASYGVAIGSGAAAGGRMVALGTDSVATGVSSMALGDRANAAHANAVALGSLSATDRVNSVSIGSDTLQRQLTHLSAGTVDTDAINLAQLKHTTASISTVLGRNAPLDAAGTGFGQASFWVGDIQTRTVTEAFEALNVWHGSVDQNLLTLNQQTGAFTRGLAGMVLQDPATAEIFVAPHTAGGTIAINGTDGRRRLTGLANGLNDDEAVTIAQLKAAGVLDPTSGTILSAVTYDDTSLANARLGGTRGTTISNLADGQIALGSTQAINGGQLFQQLTDVASLLGGGASVGLQGTFVSPTYAIQNGTYHNVGDALAALDGKVNELDQRTSGGTGGMGLMAAPSQAMIEDAGVVAPAPAAPPTPMAAVAADPSIALDASTSTTGSALGTGAIATADGSVALGSGSVADRANAVSVGSVGNERQIAHVADATEATDAVNKGQLDRGVASANHYTDAKMDALNDSFQGLRGEVDGRLRNMDRRIDRQGAMSAAMLNMATSAAGIRTDNRVGVGVGFQGSESALSVGYQRALSDRATVTLGGAFSGDDASVGFGAGFGW